MPITLAAAITFTSALALVAVIIWRPDKAISCAVQVLVLLALLSITSVASDFAARLGLVIGSSVLMISYQRQGRLTRSAMILAAGVSLFVILQYPPTWTLAIAFLLGWANFVGSLDGDAHGRDKPGARDMTDLAPAAVTVFFGATLVDSDPNAAAVIVFSALSFIANDVLASDLGPQLPGEAHLLPHMAAVPHGTPGAMSYAGTLAGCVGSLGAGVSAGALLHSTSLGVSVFLAGSVAALLDTTLSRQDIRVAMSRGRELINLIGCAAAIGLGLLMSWPFLTIGG